MTTREKIILAAKSLFFERGYKKVSIIDICEEASVSKMTFYRNFKNKEDIVIQMLTYISNQGLEKYMAIRSLPITFKEKMEKLMAMKHQYAKEMSVEFFQEIYMNGGVILEALQKHSEQSMALFIQDLEEAKSKGEIRKDLNIGFVMHLLNHASQLIDDPHLMQLFPKVEDLVSEITKFYLYGFVGDQGNEGK